MKFLIKNEINLCHREGMFRRNNLSIIQRYSKKKNMHVVGGFKKFEDRFNSHYSPC